MRNICKLQKRISLFILLILFCSPAYTNVNYLDKYSKRNDLKLVWAASSGETEAVEELIKAGFDPNIYSGNLSPLMMAASKGKTETVRVLIQAGANLNIQNHEGRTGPL